jgi:transcriptional regulator EpsA
MRIFDLEANLGEEQAQPMVRLMHEAGRLRNHEALVEWLAGPVQAIIPHRAVIAGWGNFHAGSLTYRSIGRTDHYSGGAEEERLLRAAHAHWMASGMQPQILPGGVFLRGSDGDGTTNALVHGLRDLRSGSECVYAFLIPGDMPVPQLRQAARLLLPSIDLAFRQATLAVRTTGEVGTACHTVEMKAVGAVEVRPASSQEPGAPLSEREEEVMHWVRLGKTNSEIAAILHLSTFTVKNHMRRIYKKLNAMNRAQAVSRVGGRTLS